MQKLLSITARNDMFNFTDSRARTFQPPKPIQGNANSCICNNGPMIVTCIPDQIKVTGNHIHEALLMWVVLGIEVPIIPSIQHVNSLKIIEVTLWSHFSNPDVTNSKFIYPVIKCAPCPRITWIKWSIIADIVPNYCHVTLTLFQTIDVANVRNRNKKRFLFNNKKRKKLAKERVI